MTEIKRYSLWLLPDEKTSEDFAAIIHSLSDRYHGPRFTPHVTLLGWVTGPEESLIGATEQLAKQTNVLRLRSQGLASEAYYFRCFYAKLEKSAELLQAHQRASDMFQSGYASDYMPHVSLVYGHLPADEKTKLRNEIHDTLPIEFTADRLQLTHIRVAVQDWRVVVTCPLQA